MPLSFSAVDGSLTSTSALSIAVPNGQTMTLDISKTTELAAGYTVNSISFDGNAPSDVDHVEVGSDGIMTAVFTNGSRLDVFKVPLATSMSPDNLIPMAGNVFAPSSNSGDIRVGDPGKGSLGKIVSSALEQSTVDLASELTTMIESQRSYQANSKVFQTGADLMDVLVNMVR
jgi:flagellar hook protein FlgE